MQDSDSLAPEASTWRAGESDDPWRRRRPVILLAEDDPADQELMRRALEQLPENCDIHIVSDGVELLEYLAPRSSEEHSPPAPDLVILDLKMPRKDGRETARAIHGELRLPTPVVIFSTSDDPHDVTECYAAGCNSYVTKPLDLRRFNDAVSGIAAYWLRLAKLPSHA